VEKTERVSFTPTANLLEMVSPVKRTVVKRRWNYQLWMGALLVWVGLLGYIPIFAQHPITRDFPWPTLLLGGFGFAFLVSGLKRAFREPQVYRGKVFGSVLSILSAAGLGLFCFGVFVFMRQLPTAEGAPQVAQKAPEFNLPDQQGKMVSLRDLLSTAPKDATKRSAALLIFYRGHW
jgi:hypothetical protein